jgi:hypothetical protein
MAVSQEDLAGNISATSPALSVTIDTVAPAAPTAPAGFGCHQRQRRQSHRQHHERQHPALSGTVPANLIVRLFSGPTLAGTDSATSTGAYAIVSSTLADGVRAMSTRFEDLAGNQSVAIPC